MFAGRMTWMFTAQLLRSSTHRRVRQFHFLASSVRLQSEHNNSCNSTPLNRFRRKILENEQNTAVLCTCKRHKSGRKKKRVEDDDSDDELDDEVDGESNSKVFYAQVGSTRVDLILKSCLGLARNKVEIALYSSKIRINGEKALKKSQLVCIGDEVDLVRGPSPKNPDFLVVSRVMILSASTQEDSIRIKYTRDKSLLIENYEDGANTE